MLLVSIIMTGVAVIILILTVILLIVYGTNPNGEYE